MRTWLFACGLIAVTSCSGGCGSKTPVPFKRDPAPAQAPEQQREAPVPQEYADATRSAKLTDRDVARADGSFRASLDWDLGADGTLDSIVVATDAQGRASFETWKKPADSDNPPEKRDALALATPGSGCVLERAVLGKIAPELALATLHVACAGDPEPSAATDPAAPPAPEAPIDPTKLPPPEPDSPAAPGARSVTVHQFAVTTNATPKVLLHVAALPPSDATDTTTLTLSVSSQDQDSDGHADVLVLAELGITGHAEPSRVPLLWLNRPSGLARERAEPEQTMTAVIGPAYQTATRDPIAALPAATQVLELQRVLCEESGSARIWVHEGLGIDCGASAAAGRAAVIRALALAKQQQLLPALQARSALDAAGFKVEAADRARVNTAIAGIRGQTSFVWERGPDHPAPSSPAIRLPALGFATDDQLLLRGPIGQSYDLRTRVQSPSAVAGGVVMTSANGSFAVVDMLRDCAGQYLRTVPASSIVSGFVAGARGTDLPMWEERPAAEGCKPGRKRPDRSGWHVLGWTARGVLLAQGANLQLVPVDAEGTSAGVASVLAAAEPAPPLMAPGALSANGLRHALPTSEGVAIIERGAKPETTLIRSPASCSGRVSDVAISPSGRRVAMLCSGRVYWAHEAPVQVQANTAVAAPTKPGATTP